MERIKKPDSHFLIAAAGWLELGNAPEALLELDTICAEYQDHPDVLEMRYSALAQSHRWEDGVQVAKRLLAVDPERASGYLHLSYATRRAKGGGLEAAQEILKEAHEKFPEETTITYNLACYACQLSHLEEALEWLNLAIKSGGKRKIKAMALQDVDLERLWDQIRNL